MKKICKHCKSTYQTKDKRQKHCSKTCSNKSRESSKVSVECARCKKTFKRYPSQVSTVNYCSRKCLKNKVDTKCDVCEEAIQRNFSHYKRSENQYCSYECADIGFSRNYNEENNPNFLNTYTNCAYCNQEIYRKRSEFKRSKNFFCSIECQGSWQSENIHGANHPSYDSAISAEERERGRSHEGYFRFRRLVYERDNYTCQVCGYAKGGILNAHHLNGYNWDIENRTNIDNAVTLCENCHKEFHSIYGNRNNTKEQFSEYIKAKAS